MDLKLEEYQAIQLLYPQEVDYSLLAEPTLLALVEHFQDEPNTATSALVELSLRKHPRSAELAEHLFEADEADCYLKAAAIDVLHHDGRERAHVLMLKHASTCDLYVLIEIAHLLADEDERPEASLYEVVRQRLIRGGFEDNERMHTRLVEARERFQASFG